MTRFFYKNTVFISLIIFIDLFVVVKTSNIVAQYDPTSTQVICNDSIAYEGECCTQTTQCEAGCAEDGALSGTCLGGDCFCTTPPSETLAYTPSSSCSGWSPAADPEGCYTRTCTCAASDPHCNPYEIMCDPVESGGGGGSAVVPTAPPGSTVTPIPPTVRPGSTVTPIPPTVRPGSTVTPLPPGVTPSVVVPPGSTVTPVPPTVPPGSTVTPVPPTVPPGSTITPVPSGYTGIVNLVITSVNIDTTSFNFADVIAHQGDTVPGASFTIAGVTSSTFTLYAGPTYTITVNTPTNYVYQTIYYTADLSSAFNVGNLTLNTSGLSGNVFAFVVFGQGKAWLQTAGAGDTYTRTDITSPVPYVSPNEYFSLNGPGGDPGVVTYGGGSFDFSLNSGSGISSGDNTLSTTRWLANNVNNTSISGYSFYDHYYSLLGAPTSGSSWSNPLGKSEITGCSNNICYIVGNPTISSAITMNSGEKYIVLVTGNLDIRADIRVNDGAFLAFIVDGSISISSGVGRSPVAYSSGIRGDVEGIYITDDTIRINGPGTGGNEQFVGRGTFVASQFVFNRDLGPGANLNYPSELFVFNPRYIVDMPEELKELPLRWEEVEP